MYNLIISLDYEIFGNGAGDVMRDMIEPTNRLLHICNHHNAKLTIMFEVAEYWAFKKYDSRLQKNLGYSPYKEIEKQIFYAIKTGHDVQLHIHPQWIGATLKDNNLWSLNLNLWGIGHLPSKKQNKNDILSIKGALFQGKKTLEDIIKPIKNDYQCIAFRAGGFSVQPEEIIISVMKEIGIIIDSSVVKGMHSESPVKIDYRGAENNFGYWWTAENSVARKGQQKKNIKEMPIYSIIEPYYKNFRLSKVLCTIKRSKIEKSDPHFKINPEKYSSSNLANQNLLKKMFKRYPMKFDFCKLNFKTMKKYLNKVLIQNPQLNKNIPIVMIGHCKDFWNDRNFDCFLNYIKNNNNIEFSTYNKFEKSIFNKTQEVKL